MILSCQPSLGMPFYCSRETHRKQARKGFRPISASQNFFGIFLEFFEIFWGIFWRNFSEFLGNFWGIVLKFLENSLWILWEFSGILWEFFGNSLGVLWEFFWEFFGNSLGIVWGCIVWGFWFGKFLWILWDFFWIFLWVLWEFQIANTYWHKVVNVTWIDAIFDLRRDKDRTNQILRSALARSRLKRHWYKDIISQRFGHSSK